MPATRHEIGQLRAAHEARMIAVPAADLLRGAAEQHHGVSWIQACLRTEGEFALARSEFDFDRPKRQAESKHVAAYRLKDRLNLVEAGFGEILIAGRDQAYFQRFSGPAGVRGLQSRVLDLEYVKFDFEAGHVIEARRGKPLQDPGAQLSR